MITILGDAATIFLLAMTAVSAFRALYRRAKHSEQASLLPAVAFAAATFTAAGVTGADVTWAGNAVIGLPVAAALIAFTVWAGGLWKAGMLRGLAWEMREDLAWVVGWLLRWRGTRRAAAKPPERAPEAVAEAVTARGIPPVLEDPALGPVPEPGELVNSAVPVPAPWAALAAYIREREPADDLELRMFTEGDAAGALAVADARHAFADTCLNTLGLDPAYVAGVLETGDSMAEHASLLAQVHKRFGVIYASVKEWISGHGPLPKNARDFLTGDL